MPTCYYVQPWIIDKIYKDKFIYFINMLCTYCSKRNFLFIFSIFYMLMWVQILHEIYILISRLIEKLINILICQENDLNQLKEYMLASDSSDEDEYFTDIPSPNTYKEGQ